jgi:geranylgeranyl diphosphate synthase type II
MIRKKTGRIIAAATQIGALSGNGTGRQVTALRKFGEELGLGFQVQDDLLDITGDAEKLGKTIGGDIVEGKKTYLLLKAIERTRGRDRDLLLSIGPGNGASRKKIDRIRTIYEREAVIGAAKREIERATRRAQRALAPIAASRSKEMLLWLSDQLVRRDS